MLTKNLEYLDVNCECKLKYTYMYTYLHNLKKNTAESYTSV